MFVCAEKEVGQSRMERGLVPVVQFDRFSLHACRRELLADGAVVPIGSRAFDVLMVLIEAGGELVTKDEVLSQVWPGTFVEENTFQAQISAIRKVPGQDHNLIGTISGRGYGFVSEITKPTSEDYTNFVHVAFPPFPPSSPPTNLCA
jgi:non-specific serine/threonine protein kinase